MKASKFLSLILSILFLLPFLIDPVFGFSTHSTTNISRTFDKIQVSRNESIMVTVSFENTGAFRLQGFYYVDHIPEGLIVNTVSVMIDGNNI